MNKRQLGCLALILISIVIVTNADAQTAPVAVGFPPFGSFGGGPDHINLANLNVHWDYQIVSKPGRGSPFNYTLQFDNSIWSEQATGLHVYWANNTMGWKRQTEALTGYVTYWITPCPTGYGPGYVYGNWIYYDPAGTAHSFGVPSNISTCHNWDAPSAVVTALDGSGYKIAIDNTPSATVYSPSGEVIVAPLQIDFEYLGGNDQGTHPPQNHTGAAQITDTNGNYISSSDGVTFIDTMSKNVLTIANSGAGPTYPTTYTYAAPGGSKSVSVGYTQYNVQTNIGCQNVSEYGPTPDSLITSITYADGSSYQLTYETTPGHPGSVTGRLASVTLPTGGTISYSYSGGQNGSGFYCDGSTAALTRTVNDGSNSFQTTYQVTQNSDGTSVTHVINYPLGQPSNETVINFSGGFETQREVWQGASGTGTSMETIETCWNGVSQGTCGPGAAVSGSIANKIRYTTRGGTTSRHDEYYDSAGLGLLTETDDLDWGYAYLGKTQITYATNLGSVVNKPASVVSYDAAGNVVSQTNYVYDDYSVNGLAQTDSYSPPPPQHIPWQQLSTPRGNLTSVSQWVSGSTTQGAQGSVYLTKKFTYFDTGVLSTMIDVNGAVTRYNLPNPDPGNTTCGFTFPTSVTPPTGASGVDLTSYTAWDCNGGVATSTTDPNVRTVATTSWDPNFWRPTAVTDQTMGYTELFSYTRADTSTNTPASTDTHWGINNTSTVHSKTILDSLGRVHVSQQEQGYNSPNYDSVETDYDSYGRPFQTTTAYVGTAGQSYCSSHNLPSNCTPPGTTATYDALGRPLHVQDAGGGTIDYNYSYNDVLITAGSPNTQRQYEYDVLGRLTSVCEITSAAGSGTCGQARQQTGYWTKYSYDGAGRLLTVIQNAQAAVAQQQTRSFTYDGLGRMLSENNPETGRTTYTYDSYSSSNSCNVTNIGDLAAKHDAAGNTICYMYDQLHRLTIIGYYDGPAQNTTPAKFFIYDAATVNGQAMQNAKGHLARAYTMYRPYSSVSTDEGFSYSPRGEMKDIYQFTANSGGFYHVSASYWSHGPMQTLNLNISGMPTITYGASDASGLDVEGRITKVMASSGQNPVTGATYVTSGTTQPLGALTDVIFGSTDSDHFDFDINTGRLTKYTFNVNGQTDVGQLSWNTNGNLQQLKITDQIPGTADSQTCNYTQDDLGRTSSAICSVPNPLLATAWGQNFSYDPFGNITKTVPSSNMGVSFPPAVNSYDQTSNRINYSGFVYDNSVPGSVGNLTSDTIHTYTWDAEDRMASVSSGGNTVNRTYDALGRMVEQNRNGVYTQIVYGPGGGKLALMNGQTLSKAFVPLLGGATAVYGFDNSTPPKIALLYYRHSDHLGSSRLASTSARTLYYSGAYAPFGESYDETGTADRSFTGNNEDTVPGLADFMFREYSSAQQGRWISPDPAGLKAVDPTDPQTWNRYAYVANRPLNSIDPLGLNHCEGYDTQLEGGEPDSLETCIAANGNWIPDDPAVEKPDMIVDAWGNGKVEISYVYWSQPDAELALLEAQISKSDPFLAPMTNGATDPLDEDTMSPQQPNQDWHPATPDWSPVPESAVGKYFSYLGCENGIIMDDITNGNFGYILFAGGAATAITLTNQTIRVATTRGVTYLAPTAMRVGGGYVISLTAAAMVAAETKHTHDVCSKEVYGTQ